MLLEMQVGEVVAMLNSQDELLGRIAEALDVLEEAGLIPAAADARSTAAASVLPTSIATEDAPVVAAMAAASTTPAAVSPGGPPIDDDEARRCACREQKEVLCKKLHKRRRHLAQGARGTSRRRRAARARERGSTSAPTQPAVVDRRDGRNGVCTMLVMASMTCCVPASRCVGPDVVACRSHKKRRRVVAKTAFVRV